MTWTVYKVTNTISDEFYIGVHKTDNPNDEYLGSGTRIRRQVAKYGRAAFRKDVVACFSDEQSAYSLEAELLKPLIGIPGCLNLHPGGRGGYEFINKGGMNNRVGNHQLAGKAWAATVAADTKLQARLVQMIAKARLNISAECRRQSALRASRCWVGRNHTDDSREKMSARKRGESNNSYGTILLHDPVTHDHRRCRGTEINTLLEQGWRIGWSTEVRKVLAEAQTRIFGARKRCGTCGSRKRQLNELGVCAPCKREAALVEARVMLAAGVPYSLVAKTVGINRTALYKYLPIS